MLDFFVFSRPNAQGLQKDVALHAQVATGHDVVDHAHAFEQGQVLESAGHAHLGHLAAVHVVKGLTAKCDAAFLRCVDTIDAIEHGAFACTVGANDGANFMFLHIERNVGQRFHTAKSKADVVHIQNDFANFFGHVDFSVLRPAAFKLQPSRGQMFGHLKC